MSPNDALQNKQNTEANQIFGAYHPVNSHVLDKAGAASSGVDSKGQQILDYIHSLPPAYEFEPAYTRQYRANPYEHEDAPEVAKQDINIPCDNHELAARIYRPQSAAESPCPALIYFHGGGFVLGSIESYDKLLTQLCAQSQVVVISVDYRLAPETTFPGAVEDTQAAVDWLVEHAQSLNLDPNRIGLGGDSAGANLATGYCLANKNPASFKPCFQLLIYPSIVGNDLTPSRQEYSEKLLLTEKLLHWFHDLYISQEQENDPRFNVLNAKEFKHLPPTFILTCGFDPLRDEGQMYVDKLIENGVTVKHSCYADMFHAFLNFGVLQQAKEAVTECAMTLKAVMAHSK
ncbi:alpha/beta hydrolase [Paraglaciecola sp. 2405UD69-4]|uniref:alpha/beta hydrolase n=1 Tax=Paraglaciecola sp. 2405UD69-4 TaxID=3391836 RepID=UPI0039C95421